MYCPSCRAKYNAIPQTGLGPLLLSCADCGLSLVYNPDNLTTSEKARLEREIGKLAEEEKVDCPDCGTKSAKGARRCRACGRAFTDAERGEINAESSSQSPANQSAPVGSFIALAVSILGIVFLGQKISEYGSSIGQFAVAVSKQAAQEKLHDQLLLALAIVVAVTSIGLIINFYSSRSGSAKATSIVVICPGCRGRVPDGQKFCGTCGERLVP